MTNAIPPGNDHAELQSRLPPGWHVENRLQAGSFGIVVRVRDERNPLLDSNRRVLRIIPSVASAKWERSLLAQIRLLHGYHAAGLSPLVDAGSTRNGDLYLAHPFHSESLVDRIKSERGSDPRWVEQVADQLLTGLSALHRLGIPHGNLRPENIFLDTAVGRPNDFSVFICDAVIGGIAAWSEGAIVGTGSRQYRPVGGSGENTFTTDLYAVGIILAELLVGSVAVRTAREKSGDPAANLRDYKEFKGASRRLKGLIDVLLDSGGPRRPVDAAAALEILRRPIPWHYVVVGLCLVSLLLLGVSWQRGTRLQEIEVLLHDQQSLTRELEATKQSLTQAKEAVARANDEPRGEVSTTTSTVTSGQQPIGQTLPDAVARERWARLVAEHAESSEPWEKLIRTVGAARAKSPLPPECLTWMKLIEKPLLDAAGWQSADPKTLPRLLRNALDAPWNATAVKALVDRLAALDRARVWWERQVNDPQQTADHIKAAVPVDPPEERAILEGWIADYFGRTTWKVRLLRGAIANAADTVEGGHKEGDIGKVRYITMYQDGSNRSKTQKYEWEDPFTYKFGEESEFEFVWRPGEKLEVLMENDSIFSSNNLIDEVFDGPFAMQKLQWQGNANAPGMRLDLEVDKCPGPPRRLNPLPLSNSP